MVAPSLAAGATTSTHHLVEGEIGGMARQPAMRRSAPGPPQRDLTRSTALPLGESMALILAARRSEDSSPTHEQDHKDAAAFSAASPAIADNDELDG